MERKDVHREKAPCLIRVSDAGSLHSVKAEHSSKAFSPNSSNLAGSEIEESLVQEANALSPMNFTLLLEGKVTVDKLRQFWKSSLSIDSICAGI